MRNKLKKTINPDILFTLKAFKQLKELLILKIFNWYNSEITNNPRKIDEYVIFKLVITKIIAATLIR